MQKKQLIAAGCLFFLISLLPFWRVFLKQEFPFNGNYLVSTYSPYKEETLKKFPNGLPSKPFFDDQLRQYLPYLEHIKRSFRNGEFPWWNPYNFSGTPFVANWQTAVFFPTTILLLFLSTVDYWTFTRILPFLLSLFFTFGYFRSLRLSFVSSLFGSLLFIFSGTFITYSQETIYNNFIFAFLPLALAGIEKYYKTSERKNLIWTSIAVILSCLAGFIQQFFYLFVFVLLYYVAKLINLRLKTNTWDKDKTNSLLVFPLSGLACSFFLLPGFDFFTQSARSAVDYTSKIKEYLLPGYAIFTYLFPDYLGNPGTRNWFGFTIGAYHEKSLYLASVFFPFLFFSLINPKKCFRLTSFFLAAFVASLVLVVRNWLSFFIVDLKIPVVGTAMFNRLIFINTFSLVVLTTLGFEQVRNLSKKDLIKIITAAIFFFGLVAFAYYFAIKNMEKDFLVNGLQEGNRQVAVRNIILPSAIAIATFGFLLGKMLFPKFKFELLFLVLIIGQGLYNCQKYFPFSTKTTLYPENHLISFLKKDVGDGARTVFIESGLEYSFNNIATFHGIKAVSGYDPLNLKNYNDQMFYSDNEEGKINDRRYDCGIDELVNFYQKKKNLLTKLNVRRYVVDNSLQTVNRQFFQRDFTKLYDDGKFSVWSPVESAAYKISYLQDKLANKKIMITKEKENSERIFLPEIFYPGWEIFINEKKITSDFMPGFTYQIELQGKKNIIRLEFHQHNFRWYFLLSLMSAILLLFFFRTKKSVISKS